MSCCAHTLHGALLSNAEVLSPRKILQTLLIIIFVGDGGVGGTDEALQDLQIHSKGYTSD
jgi:hypothetical protein